MTRKMPLSWLPLTLASTLGFSAVPLLPIWLTGAAERFHLTPLQSGMLASLESGCVAVASIVAAAVLHSIRNRLALALAVPLSIAGNFASFLATDAGTLAVARAVVGICYGVALAESTRQAARMPNPQRVFALQQVGLVVFAAASFTTAPQLITSLGPAAPFLYNVVLGALTFVSLVWLPSSPSTSDARADTSVEGKSTAAVGITFVAIALSFAAQTALWVNIATAAKAAGIPLSTLSQVLAMGAILNIVGPLAAGRLGLRWGRTAPLLVGYVGLALSILAITQGARMPWFAAGAIGLSLFLLFVVPFLFAILAGLDDSGRGAAAGPAFLTIGAAIGPAVGGFVLSIAGFAMLGMIGVIAVGCALLLGLVAGVKVPRHRLVPGESAMTK